VARGVPARVRRGGPAGAAARACGDGGLDVEVFRRKWECYFAYSEAGFATRTLGDVVVTVAREDAAESMEDVPL